MSPFDRVRVLVVADETAFAAWEPALRARGFEAVRSGPKEARGAAARDTPGAVLISADQRRGNGFLVCQQLKKDRTLRAIPLVLAGLPAVTAEKHGQLRIRADGYAADPAPPETVAAVVESTIERVRAEVQNCAWRSPAPPAPGRRFTPGPRTVNPGVGGRMWMLWLLVVVCAAAAWLALR